MPLINSITSTSGTTSINGAVIEMGTQDATVFNLTGYTFSLTTDSGGGSGCYITLNPSTIDYVTTVKGGVGATGGLVLLTAGAVVNIYSGTGTISISDDAAATTVNIATGAAAKALTIGSTNTTSSVTINTGSGGITIPSFTTTGALVSDASGVITDANASTSGFVLTSNGAGSAPSFQAASAGGLAKVDQTATTLTLAVNTIYSMNSGSLITGTLPATSAFGDIIQIVGYGTGGWRINQNASQVIHFGAVDTTTGTGGRLLSTYRYDQVTLFCSVANTDWVVTGSVGSLDAV